MKKGVGGGAPQLALSSAPAASSSPTATTTASQSSNPHQRSSTATSSGRSSSPTPAPTSNIIVAAKKGATAAAISVMPSVPSLEEDRSLSYNQQRKLARRPKSILDFLCSLDAAVLQHLYTDTFTCLTVFRSLPDLAKQYVLRLLCIDDGINRSLIESWVRTDLPSQQLHRASITRMLELKLLLNIAVATTPSASSREQLIRLNPPFQLCLRNALCNQSSSENDAKLPAVDSPPDISDIDKATHATWDQLLHYMVGATSKEKPGEVVRSRLVLMTLMNESNRITSKGFAFLFKDQHSQVWDLIIAYIDTVEEYGFNREEVLRFLFRLSFLKLGQEYPMPASSSLRLLVSHLTQFGLVYQHRSIRDRYYATRLALNLSSTPTQSAAKQEVEGFIIVETTFKLYAFTDSPLKLALLKLFCRLDYRLPNMMVGLITKDSIRHALKNGISSNEIIAFMDQYAHPQMRVKKGTAASVLPGNVPDQIRLWEAERERMDVFAGTLIVNFDSIEQFNQVLELAQSRNLLLYHNRDKQTIVTTSDGYEPVKSYLQQLRAAGAIRGSTAPSATSTAPLTLAPRR